MDVKYLNGGSVKKVKQAVAPGVEEVTYMECGRNHGLASGGHVVDGCGEWMPLGDHNPADASSYKCAACGCDRNFHRKSTTREGTEYDDKLSVYRPLQPPPAYHPARVAQQPPPYISCARHSRPLGALQIQRLTVQRSPVTAPPPHGVMSERKRSRTMFTADQKLRMQELSEHLGWSLQKRDKDIIEARARTSSGTG
uniref:ZF-HD dimerization-type domain-containing protein n=1 Tax=Triticum aestivum TaxID=4565 RepID=A0A077RY08_WHEAT|nr:unnamed protein product [Triticum aestivum]